MVNRSFLKKKRKSSFFFNKLFLILTLIVVLAGLLFLLVYWFVSQYRETNVRKNALARMEVELEGQLDCFERVYNGILLEDSFQPRLLFQHKYNELEAVEDIKKFANYSSILDLVFLYYQRDEMAFTEKGKNYLEQIYIKKLEVLDEKEQTKITSKFFSNTQMIALNASEFGGNDTLLFLHPVYFPLSNYEMDQAVIGYIVSQTELLERLTNVSGYQFNELEIYFQDTCILDIGEMDLAQIKNPARLVSQNGKFRIYTDNLWSFVQDNFLLYFILTILVLVLLIIISYWLVYFGTKNAAQSLQKIADKIGADNQGNDIFSNIQIALEQNENRKEEIIRRIKSYFLKMVLQGTMNENIKNNLKEIKVYFPFDYNLVFIVNTPEHSEEEMNQLTENIETLSDEEINVYAISVPEKNRIIVLCNMKYINLQETIYDNIQSLVFDEGENCEVYMGRIYQGEKYLSASYQDAINLFHQDNETYKYGGKLYQTLNEYVKRISDSIEDNNIYMIILQLNEIENAIQNHENHLIFNYVKNILNSYLYQLFYQNSVNPNAEITAELDNAENISDYKKIYLSAIELVFESNEKKQKTEKTIGAQLVEMIHENYQDADFNLELLADKFRMSTDYISRIIKNETGKGFKDYLTNLRMKRAQELLLCKSNLKISDVAEQVGYRTTSNFIRKFEEEFGYTPLQYRNSNNNMNN